MMGLGYLGGGGSSSSSSSSSNLSPLAPPFTVDRSNHRAPNFSDQSYGIPFTSSLQNWSYSQNPPSRPDLLPDSARTTAISSVNDYGYLSSDPISPLITAQWPPVIKTGSDSTRWSTAVEPSPKSVSDSFSYLSEAKPYYPPYVSPGINDDIPLVPPNEPSYDLLSSSGFVAANGSSQVDYTQSLSGLEYAPQWDNNIWNGLSEGKRGKRMESDDSFFSEDANIAGSIAYKAYMNQGTSPTDTLNKGKEDSAILPENYADIVRRDMQNERTITGNLEGKSVSAKNQRPVAIDFIKVPSSRAFQAFPESYPQASSPEPPKETWSNQQPYTLYEKRFQMFDAGVNDCISITKSSPGLVIKPPSVVATIPVCGSISSKNGEIGNLTSINRNGYDSVSSHSYSKEKEPCEPLASYMKEGCLMTNQLGSQMGRNDHSVTAPYSFKEEISSNLSTQDGLDQTLKSRSTYQVLNVPDGNSSLSVKSAANSSEYLDHHNPAEDSPCWKGAPTSHVFPFEASEDFTSQHTIKKPQTSSGNKIQGDSPKVPLQQLFEKALQNENLFVDNGLSFSAKRTSSANFSEKEKMVDAVNTGCDSAKLGSSKEVQASSDVVKPKDGYGGLCESNSDPNSITSQVKLPSHSNDVLIHKRKLQLQKGVLDHTTAPVNLFSSAENVAKLIADAKVCTHTLVDAIHNASEMLLFHSTNDVCTLEEEHHEALARVVGNLNACMSRKILPVTPTEKLMLAEKSTSNVIPEGANPAESQITHKADASSQDQVVLQSAHDENRNSDITGKTMGQFQGFVSLKDVADLARDHNMVQAIKKVLEENLECEELQTESLLYKNLWLEAEAELCSVSYKARFERMKREIEKSKPLNKVKAADVSENTMAIEKPTRSNISPDPTATPALTPEATDRGGQVGSTNIQDSPLLSPDSQVDEVEPAIMARFHILKRRGESNPVNLEENEPAVVIDAGVSATGSQNSAVIVNPPLEHLPGEDNSVAMHYRGNISRMQNQFGAAWYNGSSYTSSDWEHVLKDEYAWQTDQGHT